MSEQKSTQLSERTCREIDHWVAKYPADQKQSAVLSALHIVQDENNGWLTEDLMNAVADYLSMPRIAVYEVATFYSLYNLEPVGRHQISVCSSISCMLRGSDCLTKQLEKKLGISVGETTADGRFTLKEVECLAACKGAPVVIIDKKYHENPSEQQLDELLAGLE